jgi:hypothetical protein
MKTITGKLTTKLNPLSHLQIMKKYEFLDLMEREPQDVRYTTKMQALW